MRKSMAKYSRSQSYESKNKLFLLTAKRNQLEVSKLCDMQLKFPSTYEKIDVEGEVLLSFPASSVLLFFRDL